MQKGDPAPPDMSPVQVVYFNSENTSFKTIKTEGLQAAIDGFYPLKKHGIAKCVTYITEF